MVDLRRLRALRAVADHGTLAAAADALHLTPSAVSQQLSALEREVGHALLEPSGRSVRLTPAAHVLLGHADALLELGRFAEALAKLEKLKGLGSEGQTPRVALAFARAYEGLGRNAEADDAYRFAADRVPGLEAGGRYVAFMAKTGRRQDAEIGMAEIERRLQKISPPLRGEARIWRDLAAKALGRA